MHTKHLEIFNTYNFMELWTGFHIIVKFGVFEISFNLRRKRRVNSYKDMDW